MNDSAPKDLVSQLREMYAHPSRNHEHWLRDAANEIEALQHDVGRSMANHNADLNSGQDTTEAYYAEMEAARNNAEDAYFKARPQLMRSIEQQCLFRAGFERAWGSLWNFNRPKDAP